MVVILLTEHPFPIGRSRRRGKAMRNAVWEELREVAWIASMVGSLSVLGVALAVMLVRFI
jgi:hypothetical protein